MFDFPMRAPDLLMTPEQKQKFHEDYMADLDSKIQLKLSKGLGYLAEHESNVRFFLIKKRQLSEKMLRLSSGLGEI
jgi:hypothetical protein